MVQSAIDGDNSSVGEIVGSIHWEKFSQKPAEGSNVRVLAAPEGAEGEREGSFELLQVIDINMQFTATSDAGELATTSVSGRQTRNMARLSRELEFLLVTLGIYTSYLYLGVAQESVYTKTPGVADFTYSELMVFTQTFTGFLAASVVDYFASTATVCAGSQSCEYRWQQMLHSLVYLGAMVFTNTSLLFVSYPTQALAKSCKILPVMLSGLFVKHIKYHWLQYLSVVMITSGVLEFQLIGGKAGGSDSVLGLSLLFGSLMCDGGSGYLTVSLIQEVIRHEHKPTSFQMMKYLNGYSSVFTGVGTLVFSFFYRSVPVWEYLAANPQKIAPVLAYGLASSVGQMFIFRAIVTFGTLTLAVITTTRKFFTVFLSIILFSHTLSAGQWWCVALVLSGSTLDAASKYLVGEKEKR